VPVSAIRFRGLYRPAMSRLALIAALGLGCGLAAVAAAAPGQAAVLAVRPRTAH
jgi:hypothetical protein